MHGLIDVAYGVHGDHKSHTGCILRIGEQAVVYFRSAKQKIIAKSSTEGELVGLSNSANVALHYAEFLRAQGYMVPPVILHQDNKSTMAMIAKGRSTSDLTKHISLRFFWLKEKLDEKAATVRYLETAKMSANCLTKPVQGAQFKFERFGITGWE